MCLMMDMICCLAVCTPVECRYFVGECFSSWPSDWQGCTGVFLGITIGRTPRLLLLRVHLRSQDVWRDIITVLHVMDGIVWLP